MQNYSLESLERNEYLLEAFMAYAPFGVHPNANFSGLFSNCWKTSSNDSKRDVELDPIQSDETTSSGHLPIQVDDTASSGLLRGRRVEPLERGPDSCITCGWINLHIVIGVWGVMMLLDGIDQANKSVTESDLHIRKQFLDYGLRITGIGAGLFAYALTSIIGKCWSDANVRKAIRGIDN